MTLHAIKTSNDESLDAPLITFDDVWSKYPRKVARKDAMKAWDKIKSVDHQLIIEAIEKHKRTEDWRKDGGRYIPYFSTWLNGERWTDQLDTDLSMGICRWNCNGNREVGKGQCTEPAVTEKNNVVFCRKHADMI